MLIQIGLSGEFPVCVNPEHIMAAGIESDPRGKAGEVRWRFNVGAEVFTSKMFANTPHAVRAYQRAIFEAKQTGYGEM